MFARRLRTPSDWTACSARLGARLGLWSCSVILADAVSRLAAMVMSSVPFLVSDAVGVFRVDQKHGTCQKKWVGIFVSLHALDTQR